MREGNNKEKKQRLNWEGTLEKRLRTVEGSCSCAMALRILLLVRLTSESKRTHRNYFAANFGSRGSAIYRWNRSAYHTGQPVVELIWPESSEGKFAMSLSENRLAFPLFTLSLALIDSNTSSIRLCSQGESTTAIIDPRGIVRDKLESEDERRTSDQRAARRSSWSVGEM